MEEKKPIILAVDDNPVNLSLLKSQMRFLPYELFTASSGEEALEMIEEEHPDVVLLDIMMPEMDGMEVLEQIRENPETENLPVIMLTAINEVENHAEALLAGANAYLTKPLMMSLLIDELDKIFSK